MEIFAEASILKWTSFTDGYRFFSHCLTDQRQGVTHCKITRTRPDAVMDRNTVQVVYALICSRRKESDVGERMDYDARRIILPLKTHCVCIACGCEPIGSHIFSCGLHSTQQHKSILSRKIQLSNTDTSAHMYKCQCFSEPPTQSLESCHKWWFRGITLVWSLGKE